MSQTTIQWTDVTWNPVSGCAKVSAGCKNCYAERIFPRPYGKTGRKFTDVQTHPDRLEQPLHWRKPRRVFVNSMSDLFHDDVPAEFILKVFSIMAAAEWHTFQILTKRPRRMVQILSNFRAQLSLLSEVWPIPNIWLGVSVEDQPTANDRIRTLLQTPAAVRFVSYEPALGPVDFGHVFTSSTLLDWLIVGGESGPGARPFNIQWARDAIRQCRASGVACFVKQLGAAPFLQHEVNGGTFTDPTIQLKDRKGGTMEEWPEDLRVREFPRRLSGRTSA